MSNFCPVEKLPIFNGAAFRCLADLFFYFFFILIDIGELCPIIRPYEKALPTEPVEKKSDDMDRQIDIHPAVMAPFRKWAGSLNNVHALTSLMQRMPRQEVQYICTVRYDT